MWHAMQSAAALFAAVLSLGQLSGVWHPAQTARTAMSPCGLWQLPHHSFPPEAIRQRLDVARNANSRRAAFRYKHGNIFREPLTGTEVGQLAPRLQNARFAGEMA